MLGYVLVRDPQRRPTIDDVAKRVSAAISSVGAASKHAAGAVRPTPRHTPRQTPRILTQRGTLRFFCCLHCVHNTHHIYSGIVSGAGKQSALPPLSSFAQTRRGSFDLAAAKVSAAALAGGRPGIAGAAAAVLQAGRSLGSLLTRQWITFVAPEIAVGMQSIVSWMY